MQHTHHLDITNHSDFLKQKRVDPITGEKIEEGHTIVICAACKSAFFIESWEYLGDKHCNQDETLSEIPIATSLQLEAKPLEYLPFLFRKGSYYPWSKNEIDKEYWITIISLFGGAILGLFLMIVTLLSFNVTLLFIEMAAISLIAWRISIFLKKNYKKKTFAIVPNHSESTYLALDLKSQTIKYKREDKIEIISFNELKELKYSFGFMPFKECEKHNHYILSLSFLTKKNKKIRYYTVFNEKQIPYWSKFLEELPYTIPVLNQK